jgi:hypothetical protein
MLTHILIPLTYSTQLLRKQAENENPILLLSYSYSFSNISFPKIYVAHGINSLVLKHAYKYLTWRIWPFQPDKLRFWDYWVLDEAEDFIVLFFINHNKAYK